MVAELGSLDPEDRCTNSGRRIGAIQRQTNLHGIPGHRDLTSIVARQPARIEQCRDIAVDVAVVALQMLGERTDGDRSQALQRVYQRKPRRCELAE